MLIFSDRATRRPAAPPFLIGASGVSTVSRILSTDALRWVDAQKDKAKDKARAKEKAAKEKERAKEKAKREAGTTFDRCRTFLESEFGDITPDIGHKDKQKDKKDAKKDKVPSPPLPSSPKQVTADA